MRVNLVSVILSTFVANVTVDWSMLGFGAHSAGSDVILQLLKNETIGAKVCKTSIKLLNNSSLQVFFYFVIWGCIKASTCVYIIFIVVEG